MGLLTVLHIFVCLLLIGLVLLQDTKGALGGTFGGGGGSNSLLGPTGATHFLAKVTRYLAIIFAVLCIVLSKMAAKNQKSALDALVPPAVPGTTQSVPAAPQTETTTQPAVDSEKSAPAPTKK